MLSKKSVWSWVAALVLMWVVGLGHAPLFDVDEGAFAEASREMLTSGDWGHTTLNGADRFDKPIFIYWFQASSMALFGVNEWAVRLPSWLHPPKRTLHAGTTRHKTRRLQAGLHAVDRLLPSRRDPVYQNILEQLRLLLLFADNVLGTTLWFTKPSPNFTLRSSTLT